jgi:hypothetical protein
MCEIIVGKVSGSYGNAHEVHVFWDVASCSLAH